MFKLIIAGSRSFTDYLVMQSMMPLVLESLGLSAQDLIIISGTARGADTLGEKYAADNALQINKYPANWSKHGRAAGPIRNEEMATHADGCLVFWDGNSRGSESMIALAIKAKIKTMVVELNYKELEGFSVRSFKKHNF